MFFKGMSFNCSLKTVEMFLEVRNLVHSKELKLHSLCGNESTQNFPLQKRMFLKRKVVRGF